MQEPTTDLELASDIVRGDIASLPAPLALALAARALLRIEPFIVSLLPKAETEAYTWLRTVHTGALAAFAAAFNGPLRPVLPKLVAQELGAPDPAIDPWPSSSGPHPALAAVACAAAATANPDEALAWICRALIAAAGGDLDSPRNMWRSAQLSPDPSELAQEAAIDFSAAHMLAGNPMPLVARRLWGNEKTDSLTARQEWSAFAGRLGLSDTVAEYDRFYSGEPPTPEEAVARLNDWMNYRDPRSPLVHPAASTGQVDVGFADSEGVDHPPNFVVAQKATPEQEPAPVEAHTVEVHDAVSLAERVEVRQEPRPEQRVPLAMFSDEPLSDERADVLDFRPYADALAGLITNPSTATPLTLAINAPWGAGKSTLARMVRHRLENTPAERSGLPHITSWFDSWAHDDADDLTGAFVATVAQAAAAARPLWRRILFPVPKALLEPGARSRRHTVQAVLVLLAILTVAAVLVSGGVITPSGWLKVLTDQYGASGSLVLVATTSLLGLRELSKAARDVGDFVRDPAAVAASGSVAAVREQLGHLIDQATRGDRRLVAFIDDLERCRPPRPVELLEVVNQLLSHRNVVTVILADMPAVAACVEIKYKDLAERYRPSGPGVAGGADSRQTYGRLYLQKIVQLQFDVPAHTDDRIRALVSSLIQPSAPTPPETAAPPPAPRLWMYGAGEFAWRRRSQVRQIRARAADLLAEGAAPQEVLSHIDAPPALATAAASIVRETVQRSLVAPRSEIWRTAEEEALRHVPPLPRNAKRLVNRMRLLIFIAQERGMFAAERELTARRIGKWAVLCERWPELAQALAVDATLLARLEEVASGGQEGNAFDRVISQLVPSHANDAALHPFVASEPDLRPVLEALLHMEPAPAPASAEVAADAAPAPAATVLAAP